MITSGSHTAEELCQRQFESVGDRLQHPQAGILLAGFNLRQVAAVNTKQFCHFDLRPAVLAPQRADAGAEKFANVSGHLPIIACTLPAMCWQLPTVNMRGARMARNVGNASNEAGMPASLQRRAKEPKKQIQFYVPLSWWEELSGLATEFDQDVSTFLREATDDWLQRARKARQRIAPPVES